MPHSPQSTGPGMRWIRNTKRLAIYARDDFRCVYCEVSVVECAALDHVQPGGGNDASNLVTACHGCNDEKKATTFGWWLRYRLRNGEDPAGVEEVRRRVAQQTFLPIDWELGRALERARGRGFGSFGAMGSRLREIEESLRHRRRGAHALVVEDEERLAMAAGG